MSKLLAHLDHIDGIKRKIYLPPVMTDIDPVDGACNLDCAWCCQAASRASRPARFMSIETMDGLGKFCRDWGVKAWRIAGDSEPLLNKNINVLINSGHANDVDMGLITNGVFLERVSQQLLEQLTWLGISLDATRAETWARLKRSHEKDFYKILENIKVARALAPTLDISIKFLVFKPEENLTKNDFGGGLLPVLKDTIEEGSNEAEVPELYELAKSLNVNAIVKEAYPKNFPARYKFTTCHATPLGGVFDSSHKFHICCDARNIFVLTDDYTRNDWQELPKLWNSEKHHMLIESIKPQQCAGCAKFRLNEILEHIVVEQDEKYQVNFI